MNIKNNILNLIGFAIFTFTFSFSKASDVKGFSYSLDLNNRGKYVLSIYMYFPQHIHLNQVRANLKSFGLLAHMNKQIKGGRVELLPESSEYFQTLDIIAQVKPNDPVAKVLNKAFERDVKDLFRLDSKCTESSKPNLWFRHCDLITDGSRGGGDLSMLTKYDEVTCESNDKGYGVFCSLDIRGTARNMELKVKMLGRTIFESVALEARQLTIKGKYEALKHFAKIWFYTVGGSVGINDAKRQYKESELSTELEKLFVDANEVLSNVKETENLVIKGKLTKKQILEANKRGANYPTAFNYTRKYDLPLPSKFLIELAAH